MVLPGSKSQSRIFVFRYCRRTADRPSSCRGIVYVIHGLFIRITSFTSAHRILSQNSRSEQNISLSDKRLKTFDMRSFQPEFRSSKFPFQEYLKLTSVVNVRKMKKRNGLCDRERRWK